MSGDVRLAHLAATGVAAALVYEKFGVGFIRRGWFNVDIAWAIALLEAGVASVAINMTRRLVDRQPKIGHNTLLAGC